MKLTARELTIGMKRIYYCRIMAKKERATPLEKPEVLPWLQQIR